MINIRNIYKQIFTTIKNDTKLLDLLGVEYKDVDNNTFLTNLRSQVIEGSAPDDLLNDYSTRLCVHELNGKYQGLIDEIAYISIDIHITQDKNMQTGILSDIVKRIVELMDSKERKKEGKQPLDIGLYGLIYSSRSFDSKASSTGWEKYTINFSYKYIK